MRQKILWSFLLILGTCFFAFTARTARAAEIRSITFPMIGHNSYSDDFGAPRVGHTHAGNDIIARKGTPLISAVDGTMTYVAYPQPSYGYMVTITDADGYKYNYLHINNDTPGTDDGNGGGMNAYSPGMKRSWPVVQGQLIGWVGDSGNAENTVSHLHFEIRLPDDTAIDPYQSLRAAKKIAVPVIPPARPEEIVPFAQFIGGASIASGNVDPSTPEKELIVGAGPGGGPQIRIFRADGTFLAQFFVEPVTMRGGVDVAAGDINGDGTDEIIVGLGQKQDPKVFVYNMQGQLLDSFLAYDQAFRGGVRVSAADLDGDGKAEIITGPGPGGGPEVRTFSGAGDFIGGFYAYDPKFHGGVDVAAVAGLPGINTGLIVTSPGPGGGPEIRIFYSNGLLQSAFFATDPTFRGGIRISTAQTSASQPTIVTIPASVGVSTVRTFDMFGAPINSTTAFEEWWVGGYDVVENNGTIYVATGKSTRRTSIERVTFGYHFFRPPTAFDPTG